MLVVNDKRSGMVPVAADGVTTAAAESVAVGEPDGAPTWTEADDVDEAGSLLGSRRCVAVMISGWLL